MGNLLDVGRGSVSCDWCGSGAPWERCFQLKQMVGSVELVESKLRAQTQYILSV